MITINNTILIAMNVAVATFHCHDTVAVSEVMLIYTTNFGMLCKTIATRTTSLASIGQVFSDICRSKCCLMCCIGHMICNHIMSRDSGMVIYTVNT